MAPTGQATAMPVIPLASSTILFPGSVLRIPVSATRSDVPALLSSVYTRASKGNRRVDQVPVLLAPPDEGGVGDVAVVLVLEFGAGHVLDLEAEVVIDVAVVAELLDDLAGGEAELLPRPGSRLWWGVHS